MATTRARTRFLIKEFGRGEQGSFAVPRNQNFYAIWDDVLEVKIITGHKTPKIYDYMVTTCQMLNRLEDERVFERRQEDSWRAKALQASLLKEGIA